MPIHGEKRLIKRLIKRPRLLTDEVDVEEQEYDSSTGLWHRCWTRTMSKSYDKEYYDHVPSYQTSGYKEARDLAQLEQMRRNAAASQFDATTAALSNSMTTPCESPKPTSRPSSNRLLLLLCPTP